jgi:hypothetical protein
MQDPEAFEHFLTTFKPEAQPILLTDFVLLKSELTADGPRYTEIERYALGEQSVQ